MKAIRLSFFQMIAYMRRDLMLFVACLVPILAGIAFKFLIPVLETALTNWFDLSSVISPYYELIDLLLTMLAPTIFCFVSAMIVLEETDEKTGAYLFITPLGKIGYLIARFGIPLAFAFVITLIILPVFKLTPLSFGEMFLLSFSGALQGLLVALLIVTLSSNKLEGMAISKLSSTIIFAAVVPYVLTSNVQFVVSPLPSFWIGKAICDNSLLYMLPAIALSALWIFILLRRYLKKI